MESLELGFEHRQCGEISQTGRQRIPDRHTTRHDDL